MTAQDGVPKEGNAPVGYHGASVERKKSLIEEHFNIDQHFRMVRGDGMVGGQILVTCAQTCVLTPVPFLAPRLTADWGVVCRS